MPDEYYDPLSRQAVPDDAAKFFGMIDNIDDNVGRLLAKLKEWGIATKTLVIFMTDNGGTAGTKIFNAGMRGGKGHALPGRHARAVLLALAGHAPGRPRRCHAGRPHRHLPHAGGTRRREALPTRCKNKSKAAACVRCLPSRHAEWPDRTLVTHVGRWPRGQVRSRKHEQCSIRNGRFTLVNNAELYDLANDPGETTNVIAEHPQVVAELRAAYDKWWNDVLPLLENEDAVGPKVNPFKELYWKQFGGGPDEALRRRMKWDPANQR